MTKLQAVRAFVTIVLKQDVVIARHRLDDNWGMNIAEKTPRLSIPSNFNYKDDENDEMFYENFISRYSAAKEFNPITLAILHECGHWETRNEINWWFDDMLRNTAVTMEDYLCIPSERKATAWAIKWLKNKKHRAIAKQFEEYFFQKGK